MPKIKRVLLELRESINACLYHINDSEYLEWHFKFSKSLAKFKDIHKGQDCFIIGNGPSLNKMDLSVLKNYYTFGLNKIYLIFDKYDLDLSYHVAVNPFVIQQSVDEFDKFFCPSFLSFRPAHNIINKTENIYYLMTGGPYTFQADILKPVCEGYTVTYVAMQIAFYMGFERVFLIGVDHNFLAKGAPNELQLLEGEDPNHFSGNYFGNQKWQLPDLEGSELSYNLAKFFYLRDKREIYDATLNGKLDIFPKVPFREALNQCKPRSQNTHCNI